MTYKVKNHFKTLKKHCETKNPQRCHWVHSGLAISCWAWVQLLRVVCILQWDFVGEKSFSFENVYQLDIASGLEMEVLSTSPLSTGGPSGFNSCRQVHAAVAPVSCCVCQSGPFALEGLVYLVSSIVSGSYNLSASSSTVLPESWGEGFGRDMPFGPSVLSSLTLCTLSSCGPLYLSPSTAEESFSADGTGLSIAECH